MFTVKLYIARPWPKTHDGMPASVDEIRNSTRFSTKIIEAPEVEVHYLRPGELAEVQVRDGPYDTSGQAFYIADRDKPRPEGFADEIDFYYEAIIENAAGKTTQIVHV